MVMFCFSQFVNIVFKALFFWHKPMLFEKLQFSKNMVFSIPLTRFIYSGKNIDLIEKTNCTRFPQISPNIWDHQWHKIIRVSFFFLLEDQVYSGENAKTTNIVKFLKSRNPIAEKMHFVCKSFKFWQLIDVHNNMKKGEASMCTCNIALSAKMTRKRKRSGQKVMIFFPFFTLPSSGTTWPHL